MFKEIEKAVEIFHSIAFGTKNNATKVPENKLAVFITVLTDLLTARYEKNWYPDNPDRGSGYRCIRVNGQSIDPTIVESLKRAKIDIVKGLIITEVTIWVDPGVVSVRIGEDGSIGPIVVDEKVYRKTKENSSKDSDEGFSSRSSSPGSSISDSSRSGSPYTRSSPVPTKYSSSPSSPAMEYNPYAPPVRVSYPSLHQHPSSAATISSQQSLRNVNPKASYFQPHVVRSQGRAITPFGSTMVSSSSSDLFSHIPVSTHQLAATYSHPRTMFSAQDNITNTSGSFHDGLGKMAFTPYQAMPMIYGSNLAQANFYDIPVERESG